MSISTLSNLSAVSYDYYNSQPFFEPFQFYNNEVINWLPNPEELSENLQHCSQILGSCTYYDTYQLERLAHEQQNLSLILSLNIDGVKTNFNKFRIMKSELDSFADQLKCLVLCETNVTEKEAEPYYLENYNKFVLGRLIKMDGSLKHKGSGILVYLHRMFQNVIVCTELCISTFDFECLVLKITTKMGPLFLIGAYRSPNGDFNAFIETLDKFLESLNAIRGHKSIICGDLI